MYWCIDGALWIDRAFLFCELSALFFAWYESEKRETKILVWKVCKIGIVWHLKKKKERKWMDVLYTRGEEVLYGGSGRSLGVWIEHEISGGAAN